MPMSEQYKLQWSQERVYPHTPASGLTLSTYSKEKGNSRIITKPDNKVSTILQQPAAAPVSGTRSISSSNCWCRSGPGERGMTDREGRSEYGIRKVHNCSSRSLQVS